jgi:putative transposase
MGRRRRIILPGFPHHVTARGNRRADVFRDTEDRLVYLSKLRDYAEKHRVALYSYSLMTNHTHKIAVPSTPDSLSGLMHDLNGAYAAYFNRKYEHCGHLWQKRFFACVLDEAHLWNAVRYVERNPVRAGLVERAEDYPWSSAAAHCGLRADPLLDQDFPPAGLVPDWAAWLATELSEEHLEEIRSNTRKGIPWASVPFLRELERLFGIPLLPRKRGRKSAA